MIRIKKQRIFITGKASTVISELVYGIHYIHKLVKDQDEKVAEELRSILEQAIYDLSPIKVAKDKEGKSNEKTDWAKG